MNVTHSPLRTRPGTGKTVLLLGGYGSAGLAIAQILLQATDVRLVLAGRNEDRAREAAKSLNAECSAERVAATRADAADPATLQGVFPHCDLVTVCTPLTGIGSGVIRAALQAKIDYVGLNIETTERAAIEALSSRVEQSGLRFLTDAGLIPGVPAVLARSAAQHFDRADELTVATVLRESGLSHGSAVDLIAATGMPSTLYHQGAWQRASLTATRSVDFGAPFGRCTCYPFDLPEIRPLPGLLGLQKAGSYAAGANGLADALVAIWHVLGLGRHPRGVQLGAKLMLGANRRTRPPFGVALVAEIVGQQGDERRRVRIAVEHTDGYEGTAIPTVACLLQMLDGTVQQCGIHLMGHAVDADRFMRDMEQLGMKPSVDSREER